VTAGDSSAAPARAVSEGLRALASGRVARSASGLGQRELAPRQTLAHRLASNPGVEVPASRAQVSTLEIEEVAGVSELGAAGAVAGAPATTPVQRREKLLADYQAAIHRPLDLHHALAAIQLRSAAEIHCTKDNLARFKPKMPCTTLGGQVERELMDVPLDELIKEVQEHPERFSRTQLTNLAQDHLLAALNIDVEAYRKGIHQAGLYEGLHSVAGRVVSVAAAGISAGISAVPGVATAVSKSVKILSHELPPNVINPALTGGLRTITDVKESFKRVGGQPVLAKQIEGSKDMGAVLEAAKEKRKLLEQALERFGREGASDPQALGALVDAFMALHVVADRQYRRRIGANRAQTYSKGYGMGVNGLAATGAVVSATVPVVGQVAGPVMLAATVPLQWGAGYLDERTKHQYNLRANTKWADFRKDDAANLRYDELRVEHVSEQALRRTFMTQPEVQIAAIREVYEDALGALTRHLAELEKDVLFQLRSGTPEHALVPRYQQSAELKNQLELVKAQASDFESFDIERWKAIPEDSLIGRCLDDLGRLEKANRKARLRKPGEGAQIVQRYVQALQAGISTGTALPVVDAITAVDASYVQGEHGNTHVLRPLPQAAATSVGVVGGTVFTAATGEVRMTKADNKKGMSALRVSPEKYAADEERWTFQAEGRRVDLRTSAGYRKTVHTRLDELALVKDAVVHGVTSGPIGLVNLLRAKAELRHARASLRATLEVLANSTLERHAPADRRAPTISAMKDALYDYPAVREHLGVPRAPGTEPGSSS